MRNPQFHECCPTEWRDVPDVTGSYELDGVIAKTPSPALRDRLEFYCKGTGDEAYGPLTAYNGYHGYIGDN